MKKTLQVLSWILGILVVVTLVLGWQWIAGGLWSGSLGFIVVLFFLLTCGIAGAWWRALLIWAVRRGQTRGTAHWAKQSEIAQYIEPQGARESRLFLGVYGKKTLISLSQEQQSSHVLLVGPTGQGKTSSIIVPGLLTEHGDRSLFVIDPKTELVARTMGSVGQRHRIRLFAPTQPAQSHRYNPLAHIHSMEDAQDFAKAWIKNTGESREPFWNRNAELLITAAVLHLREAEPTAPFSRLADILTGLSYPNLRSLFAASPSATAKNLADMFLANLSNHERLAVDFLTEMSSRFFMLHNENLKAVTSSNEIDFNAMIDHPTALYLSIPASAAERLRPLSACLIMQMFAAWIARAEQSPRNRLPRAIACYLDEFANAGNIPHMATRISMLRSTGVALILAIQNFSQLDAVYGPEDRKTLLANATTHLVFPGTGQEEVEYYSRRAGDTTVYARSLGAGGSVHTSPVQRRLIMPDEIRRLPKESLLMIADNAPPLLIGTAPYYRISALMQEANLPYKLPNRTKTQAPPATPNTQAAPTTNPQQSQQQPGYLAPE